MVTQLFYDWPLGIRFLCAAHGCAVKENDDLSTLIHSDKAFSHRIGSCPVCLV